MSIYSSKKDEQISERRFFGIQGQPEQRTNQQERLLADYYNRPTTAKKRGGVIIIKEIPMEYVKEFNKQARIKKYAMRILAKILDESGINP